MVTEDDPEVLCRGSGRHSRSKLVWLDVVGVERFGLEWFDGCGRR